MSVMRT